MQAAKSFKFKGRWYWTVDGFENLTGLIEIRTALSMEIATVDKFTWRDSRGSINHFTLRFRIFSPWFLDVNHASVLVVPSVARMDGSQFQDLGATWTRRFKIRIAFSQLTAYLSPPFSRSFSISCLKSLQTSQWKSQLSFLSSRRKKRRLRRSCPTRC